MKKIIALILSITVALSLFGVCTFAASYSDYTVASSGVVSATVDVLPENAQYNQVISFTVTTDTNTSKVKICRTDGSVYTLANIFDGFENYSDANGVRTWNISKRVQIAETISLNVYGGNCAYEYSQNSAFIQGSQPEEEEPATEGLWNKTATEITDMINVGWCLGNTLDSWGDWITAYGAATTDKFETAWGNPVTTKAMLDTVKAKGFNLIRIPVTWYQHIDTSNGYKIDDAWMARVKEVVDYAIDDNTFVILNTHHEDEWLNVDGSLSMDTMKTELAAVWTQIAEEFKDYDQHLIFEIQNETRDIGETDEWYGNSVSYERVNQLNMAGLEAIRATGGNNATQRCVMLPTYAASSNAEPMNAIEIPENDNHIIVSIHAYTPYNYTVDHSTAFSSSIEQELDYLFNNISAMQKAKNNVPIIIGEFGCYTKNDGTSRNQWLTAYLSRSEKYGYPCAVWDNGSTENYQILNRNTLTWDDEAYIDIMVNNTK